MWLSFALHGPYHNSPNKLSSKDVANRAETETILWTLPAAASEILCVSNVATDAGISAGYKYLNVI